MVATDSSLCKYGINTKPTEISQSLIKVRPEKFSCLLCTFSCVSKTKRL